MSKTTVGATFSLIASLVGCDSSTAPNGVRIELLPADTTIATTQTYKLRLRVFGADGIEINRNSYNAQFVVSDTNVARVGTGDVVQPLHGGTAGISVTVPTSSGSLRATAIVRVGIVISG